MDIPKTSKAMVLEKFCEPSVIREIAIPELGPGDMLVKPVIAGICGTDVHLARDELSMHPPTPIIEGHETVARIIKKPDSITTDVAGTPVKEGDRIMWAHQFCGKCYACKILQQPYMCLHSKGYGFSNANQLRGGFAEYEIVTEGTDFVRVPDSLTDEEAVGAGCAGRTIMSAYEKVYAHGGIKPGDYVVIQGCGPVGLYATVVAAQSPAAKVITIDMSEPRLQFSKRWGATDTVSIKDYPDPAERVAKVRELCGGIGANLVVECSGVPSAVNEGLDMMAKTGMYLLVGQTSTRTTPIRPNQIQDLQACVLGSSSADIRHFYRCLKFIEANRNKYPFADIISDKYKLEDANQALEDMRNGVALKAAIKFED